LHIKCSFVYFRLSQPEIRSVSRTSRLETIQNLRERVYQLERSSNRPVRGSVLSTGSALDQLLPEKGWAAGTLIEWLSEGEGSGAATLAFAVTAELLRHGGALIVIDGEREFYPPAVAGRGIPLERTVVVQPRGPGEALWALEQALRSRAAMVVFARIGASDDRILRRLQLAAETGGGFGFLVRPAICRKEPSRAETRWWVETTPAPRQPSGWRLRASVLHQRGGAAGEGIELELSHEASLMRAISPLAGAALPPRAAGA
jgi:protein ImuA